MDVNADMEAILQVYRAYKEWLRGRPDIPARVAGFLEVGLARAERVASRRSNPLFDYGSDATYRCRNKAGVVMMLQVWGNTDGWGIVEVS
jgi:hypothetical protein